MLLTACSAAKAIAGVCCEPLVPGLLLLHAAFAHLLSRQKSMIVVTDNSEFPTASPCGSVYGVLKQRFVIV